MPKRFKLVLCFLLSLLLLSGCVTLEKAKANAIQELSSYVDLADYLENARLQIQGIIDDAQSAIEEAGSKAEVDRIVTDAKTQINQILTKKALEEYQTHAITVLNKYIEAKTYSVENQQTVQEILRSYVSEIIKAASAQEIENLVAEYKNEIDGIPQIIDEMEDVVIINDDYQAVRGEILMHQETQKRLFVDGIGNVSYTSDTKVYQFVRGNLVEKNFADLALAMKNLYFYINRHTGRIDYIVINGDLRQDAIKVFINRSTAVTGDNDRYHPSITLSSSGGLLVRSGSTKKTEKIAAFSSIALYNEQGKVALYQGSTRKLLAEMVIVEPISDKITVTSIGRSQGTPSYYGRMEITPVNGNLQLVNNVNLEDYLKTVVPSEMPASWNLEALKAQAICARTYALADMLNQRYAANGYHVDDSVMSQVYNNAGENPRSNQAIAETKGLVMQYNGSVISAVFFSTGSGATGLPGDAWFEGTTPVPDNTGPYHSTLYAFDEQGNPLSFDIEDESSMLAFYKRIKVNSYDMDSVYQRWHYQETKAGITSQLQNNLPARHSAKPDQVLTKVADSFESRPIPADIGTVTDLNPVSRGEGGLVTCLEIETTKYIFRVYGEYNIRMLFRNLTIGTATGTSNGYTNRSFSFLPSAYFALETSGDTVHFYGGGYGHGTGMSQYGANNMASRGKTFEEILKFYYNNFEFVEWVRVEEPTFNAKEVFNLLPN
ncbi:MAG TPA: SpoIID/LytB domain-containing protein [Bacilli bacterium]|nr:SpoIID/LytB domain-containing protein [Bacilli bacterium]